MLQIRKNYIVDESQKKIAVQIPVDDFNRMEEVIENFGLAKLMDEVKEEKSLTLQEAKQFYKSLKKKAR
ncbi:MAG: hypothetical protein FVQ77_08305 [Cytophagales bacterium]|nr:hypothetical protein [Cytophagales bacterium]